VSSTTRNDLDWHGLPLEVLRDLWAARWGEGVPVFRAEIPPDWLHVANLLKAQGWVRHHWRSNRWWLRTDAEYREAKRIEKKRAAARAYFIQKE
jgi:hypothetical protein